MQNEFDFKTHYQDNSISKSKDKDKYPYKAGHRGVRTSIVSAEDIDKRISRLHKQVIIELAKVFPKGLTTSELADKTQRNLLTIRPRTTELKLQGLIIDTEKDKTQKDPGGFKPVTFPTDKKSNVKLSKILNLQA